MWRKHLHPLPAGARLSSPTRPINRGIRRPQLHFISGRAILGQGRTVPPAGHPFAQLLVGMERCVSNARGQSSGRSRR